MVVSCAYRFEGSSGFKETVNMDAFSKTGGKMSETLMKVKPGKAKLVVSAKTVSVQLDYHASEKVAFKAAAESGAGK